jgi:hypothetical protein
MKKKQFNVLNLKKFKNKSLKTLPNVARVTTSNKAILDNNLCSDASDSNTLFGKIELFHISHLKELILSVGIKPHIVKRLQSAFTFCILRMNKIPYKLVEEL